MVVYPSLSNKVEGWQAEGIPPRGKNLTSLTDLQYFYSIDPTVNAAKIKPGETKKRRKWLRIRDCISDPNTMFHEC